MSEESSDSDRIEQIEETVQNLEQVIEDQNDELQQFRSMFDAVFQNAVRSRFDEIEATSDDLSEKLGEHDQQIAALENEFVAMGVDDRNETPLPQKRASDLRRALVRRATSKNESDHSAGRAAMYYKEVQDLFADIGYGHVHRPEVMKAMRDASVGDGFSMGSKRSQHGNQVKAVRVATEDLPPGIACRNPTTREQGVEGQIGHISGGDESEL